MQWRVKWVHLRHANSCCHHTQPCRCRGHGAWCLLRLVAGRHSGRAADADGALRLSGIGHIPSRAATRVRLEPHGAKRRVLAFARARRSHRSHRRLAHRQGGQSPDDSLRLSADGVRLPDVLAGRQRRLLGLGAVCNQQRRVAVLHLVHHDKPRLRCGRLARADGADEQLVRAAALAGDCYIHVRHTSWRAAGAGACARHRTVRLSLDDIRHCHISGGADSAHLHGAARQAGGHRLAAGRRSPRRETTSGTQRGQERIAEQRAKHCQIYRRQ